MRGAIYSGGHLQNARFDFEGKILGPKFNSAPNRYQKWILYVKMGYKQYLYHDRSTNICSRHHDVIEE